jgi:hypothetical protein
MSYKHLPYCCMTSPAHALYNITSHVHVQTRRKRFHCIVASSCWGTTWPLFRNALSKFVTIYIYIYIYIIKSLYSSTFYYGPVSLKISLSTILVKLSHTEFHKNLSTSLAADTRSRTNGRYDPHFRCSLLLCKECQSLTYVLSWVFSDAVGIKCIPRLKTYYK